MNLAKLEMRALLTALTRKVTRFHIEAEERALNNILRGFSKLIVTVENGRMHWSESEQAV